MVARFALLSAVVFAVFAVPFSQAEETPQKPEEMNKQEVEFQKMLKGAVLVGNFSVIKDGEESEPKKDRYKVVDLKKLPNGFWLFTFQYGDKPAIPMPLPVKWADDTPVIALTDVAIPGLGTFSCRVLFHEGQYAGTWRHGEVIGNMWGVIQPPKADEK